MTAYGTRGNGKNDDTKAIQNAFNHEKNVKFPKGRYLINSSSNGIHNAQSLIITNKTKVRNIIFEDGAELYIGNDFNFKGSKNSIIKIYTESGNIDSIRITGLKIFAENINYTRNHTGLFAIENNGFEIQNLEISKASFYNLSGAGIITYALKTELSNIYTENTSSHGIGALNPYNLGKEHFLYIDGYTSINDRAYSIDFSGTEHADNRKVADSLDVWTGIAKNIKSINSKRGIKTAGYWNLHMENVEIINSAVYGLFINKDAPGRKITFKNMTIDNSGDAGLSLSGRTGFEGQNLKLINCKMGAILQNVDVKLKNIYFDGKGNSQKGIRFQGSGIIEDFIVTGVKDEYAVWITAKNAILKNGKIFNNDCHTGLLIHETPENVIIDNIVIYDERTNPIQVRDVMVLQKKGKIKIIEPALGLRDSKYKKLNIENKSGIRIERSY